VAAAIPSPSSSTKASIPRRDSAAEHLNLSILRWTASCFPLSVLEQQDEQDELCNKLGPVLDMTARSTGDIIKRAGRPAKLSAQQRILNALMYLKHDNTVSFEAFQWDWSKSSVSDDVLFVCPVINTVLAHEIRWPDANERSALAQRIPEFQGCIGFIGGHFAKYTDLSIIQITEGGSAVVRRYMQ
jgi:hypothetical protein